MRSMEDSKKNVKKILVLMSSFNGEQYIYSQIESIMNQEDVDVYLRLRDDGSTDQTAAVLEKIQNRFPSRIEIIRGENIGAKKSFLTLVKNAPQGFDYYALSDQDDIWDKSKLYKGILRIEENGCKGIPIIYGSPVQLYSGGNVGKQIFNEATGYTFGNFLIKNYIPGCTMLFNTDMKYLVEKIDPGLLSDHPLHDHWMNLICSGCGGKIIVDKESYIYYRQHQNNVVGGERTILTKLKDNGIFTHNHTRYMFAKELYKYYRDDMSKESREKLLKVLLYRKSFRNRLKLALDMDIKPVSRIEILFAFANAVIGAF